MRILFVGPTQRGSTSLQRMNALQEIGHDIQELNTAYQIEGNYLSRLSYRVLRRLELTPHIARINKLVQQEVQNHRWDIIWLDKALEVKPAIINEMHKQQDGCRVIFYSPDNMLLSPNQTRSYLHALPLYDLQVTTKSHNIVELKKLGAGEVLFVDKAFDPNTHRPIHLTDEEKSFWGADVGFVGGFEQERYETMLKLAEAGINLIARGPGWEPYVHQHPNLTVLPGWVYDDDYARSICATKINLGFLRKIALDKQTARSIEIPACGGFMLAERTDEHLRLFAEGKEAEFFGDLDELLNKILYYLEHDMEREQIAQAGHKRCVESGYSNHDRLKTILEYAQNLSKANNKL